MRVTGLTGKRVFKFFVLHIDINATVLNLRTTDGCSLSVVIPLGFDRYMEVSSFQSPAIT